MSSIETQYPKPLIDVSQANCLSVSPDKNLLRNPGFESGWKSPDDWQMIVPDRERQRSWLLEVAEGQELAHKGSKAIRIGNTFNGVNSESSWMDRVILESRPFNLVPESRYYLVSVWVNCRSVEEGHVGLKVKYFDKLGERLTIRWHRWDTFYLENDAETGWRRYAYIVEPPDFKADRHGQRSIASKASISITVDHSAGSCLIDDVLFMPISSEEYRAHDPALNYIAPSIQTKDIKEKPQKKKSRAISVYNDDGVWWFYTPEGEKFWSAGLTFSENEFVLRKTGLSRKEYLRQAQIKAANDLYFNQGVRKSSVAGNSFHLSKYIEWLNFSSEAKIKEDPEKWLAKDRNGDLIGEYTHYFPDVFSPIWQEHAAREARKLLDGEGWVLESKETIGYWTDNEWAYGDLYDFIWGDISKYAFIEWLQGKNTLPTVDRLYEKSGSRINLDVPQGFEIGSPYHEIDELNKAWSSRYHRYRYESFKQISFDKALFLRAHDDPIAKDLKAFVRLMYKVYVDTVVDNIRKVEQEFSRKIGYEVSHLIFSNRFSIETPAALSDLRENMDLFGRFDVIAVNLYPDYNHTAMFYSGSLLRQIKQTFYDTTGRPLYISEFGVAAEDASNCLHVPCLSIRRWRPQTVDDQNDRGKAYENIISTLSHLSWVVGANWFKWTNGYGIPEGSDPRNCGLVDDNDNYYEPLTRSMVSVNRRLAHIERFNSFTLDDIDWLRTKITICEPEKQ